MIFIRTKELAYVKIWNQWLRRVYGKRCYTHAGQSRNGGSGYPIVIFGCTDGISHDTREKLNILDGYETMAPQLAIDLLEKMIKGEKVESIRIEPKVICEEKSDVLNLIWLGKLAKHDYI